jgi:DNA-binding response OmpR family regulator
MDGLELHRRARNERPTLPVIFVTAHDDDDTRQQALKGGAVAFIVKPFDAAELIERIETAVRTP